MLQYLFVIPFLGIAVPGYGVMLAIALLLCTELTARLFARTGGDPQRVYDLSIPLMLLGIGGARLFYVIQYRDHFKSFWQTLEFWNGGLVVYGSAIGGFVAFWIWSRKWKLPRWSLADAIAPSLALGLALGRIGCFLNGCCYGDFCEAPWALSFPGGSDPAERLVGEGSMTRLGFLPAPGTRRDLDGRAVWVLDPGGPAKKAGLEKGDVIVGVNGAKVEDGDELREALFWADRNPKTRAVIPNKVFNLDVRRGGKTLSVLFLPARSLPLHPAQLYSAVGAFFLFLFLYHLHPLRRREGEAIAAFAVLYSIGRFLIEFLRYDEATLFDGLTISQNLSIVFFAIGVALWLYVRVRGVPVAAAPASPAATISSEPSAGPAGQDLIPTESGPKK
ncbi:MAG TPA: prolipoprotein diacylglyceryl transferase family protein [Planctomycetia bacterium]|nr:prolipoprotein diacylglyceryl transferase family protein [Planctomycetia bacterium]